MTRVPIAYAGRLASVPADGSLPVISVNGGGLRMLRFFRSWAALGLLGCGLLAAGRAQDAPPPVPQGVEVQARGPVHEAFATLTADPAPTKAVSKRPPTPLEELPPEEKPEGDMIWISGYWAWDDDRSDFLWVSGIWRAIPPGKQWVAGYWREVYEAKWHWVPGFWTTPPAEDVAQEVTYLPPPPPTPDLAPPGEPPTAESFYVPGFYVWTGRTYAWRSGYWAKV